MPFLTFSKAIQWAWVFGGLILAPGQYVWQPWLIFCQKFYHFIYVCYYEKNKCWYRKLTSTQVGPLCIGYLKKAHISSVVHSTSWGDWKSRWAEAAGYIWECLVGVLSKVPTFSLAICSFCLFVFLEGGGVKLLFMLTETLKASVSVLNVNIYDIQLEKDGTSVACLERIASEQSARGGGVMIWACLAATWPGVPAVTGSTMNSHQSIQKSNLRPLVWQ